MTVKELEINDWKLALITAGIPAEYLTGRGTGCPMCGDGGSPKVSDRFTFDNNQGRGDWVCRKCNGGSIMAGDGVKLIQRFYGLTYTAAIAKLSGLPVEVRRCAPKPSQVKAPQDSQSTREWLRKIWREAKPIQPGDLAAKYLENRVPGFGANGYPASLRLHPNLFCNGDINKTYPCILAVVKTPDGRAVCLHRHWINPKDLNKAVAKRQTPSPYGKGAASQGVIHLFDVDDVVGVAEGIETALGASMMYGIPVQSCINRVLLEHFVPPAGVNTVHIFADYDEIDEDTGVAPGMAAAWELRKRLLTEGKKVVMHRPRLRDTDFADEWKSICNNRLAEGENHE
jgi:putative DNA primase/helicase